MIGNKKAFVIEIKTLMCNSCGEDVYKCDECDNYFDKGDNITCKSPFHYCSECS